MNDSYNNPLKKVLLLLHFTFSGGEAQEDLPSVMSRDSNPGLTTAEPIHSLFALYLLFLTYVEKLSKTVILCSAIRARKSVCFGIVRALRFPRDSPKTTLKMKNFWVSFDP